jgi:hypothetical protein
MLATKRRCSNNVCWPTEAAPTTCAACYGGGGASHTPSPERKDQKQWRARRGGRPPSDAYARRNAVERCAGRLKQSRVLATCYEERAANYRAVVVVLPCGGCAIVPPFRIGGALHYDTPGLHI